MLIVSLSLYLCRLHVSQPLFPLISLFLDLFHSIYRFSSCLSTSLLSFLAWLLSPLPSPFPSHFPSPFPVLPLPSAYCQPLSHMQWTTCSHSRRYQRDWAVIWAVFNVTFWGMVVIGDRSIPTTPMTTLLDAKPPWSQLTQQQRHHQLQQPPITR